ncbi:MAG: DUF1624 domain-containing protein [Candidatus Aenigmarchaeota archaeon]|nr:DUF1624 domain-containing protein [Candidatus Aenigmarchaeota archaeon]
MRLIQLDTLRGFSIILMVVFNWSFAFYFLGIIHSDNNLLYWWLFPRAIGASFITIAGISLALSYEKVKQKNKSDVYKKFLWRGERIFTLGLAITAVTFFAYPSYTVWFGILHLIGLSIVISTFMLKYNKLNLITGLAIITLGIVLDRSLFAFQLNYLSWLIPSYFQTFDYFPLLPWLGFMLVGIWAGKTFFVKMKPIENKPLDKTVAFLGRHSLIIYIVHQPLLLLVLYLSGFAML